MLGAGSVVNFLVFLLAFHGPTLPWPLLSVFRDVSLILVFVPFAVLFSLWQLSRRSGPRQQVVALIAGGLVLLGSTAGGAAAGQHLRMQAFRGLAERSGPLVRALQAYELQSGEPARSLQDLVPAILPSVPDTGMNGCRAYEYVSGADARRYEGNVWVLVVPCGGPGINFDEFLYFPRQNYPERGYGGWLERIGAWAYVHE